MQNIKNVLKAILLKASTPTKKPLSLVLWLLMGILLIPFVMMASQFETWADWGKDF